jgi:Transposase DDE domain
MTGLQAAAWVLTVCTDLRLSQTKTLADLVAASLCVGRVTLAAIGRKVLGAPAAKHKIKRTWRFCANRAVTVSDAMQGPIARLCKKRKKPLLVAMDWVEVRAFHTLVLAAVKKGRSIPLLWASYPEWEVFKSQNNLEEGLLRLFHTLVPDHVTVVLLADRGFGRTEMARLCEHLNFRYLIRIKSDVTIAHPSYRGLLHDYPVKKGMRRLLKGVRYRKNDPVTLNLVIRWKPGLPAKRDEPWFLFTDLEETAVRLTERYRQRMTIEELFRDEKNHRNGLALRHTQITKADRFDRLLLILALAYWLLVGIGLVARRRYRPGQWCSSNDPGQCSDFTIGRIMLDQTKLTAQQALEAVFQATEEAVADLKKTEKLPPKLGTT